MIRIFLVIILFVQSSFGFAPSKVGMSDALQGVASVINATADYNSFLHLMGILTAQSDQVEKIKSKIDKTVLKTALPKARINDDGSLSLGNSKISIVGELIYIDGKKISFDSSKSLVENYEEIERTFKNQAGNPSAFNLLVSPVYAKEMFPNFVTWIGVGLMIWNIGEKSNWPWIAGLLLVFHSCSASASDGFIPLQTCEKKDGFMRNSFQDIRGDLFTQDQKVDPSGNLIVTVRRNGKVEKTITFGKKDDKYHVIGVKDGSGKKVVNVPSESAAENAYRAFSECSDPKLRQLKVKSADEIRKAISAGDIKLAEEKLRSTETQMPSGTH